MDQTPAAAAAAASSPPAAPEESAAQPEATAEALRLKSLAEQKLQSSSIKSALKYARRARRLAPNLDGIEHMVTALKILRASPSDHYKILRLDPFSPISAIKKQYKTLALALHPDKSASPVPGAEEAFKRVSDSFRFLSDRSNKKDLDLRLRLELSLPPAVPGPVATFWTACATCRLLHEFDRRYVGHRLVCPVCRKSFLADEVKSNANDNDDDDGNDNAPNGNGFKPRVTAARSRSNTRPRIPTGWSLSDAKRKADASSPAPPPPAASKKPKQVKEKTLAELQLELTTARKESNDKKKGTGKEKAIVPSPPELQLELTTARNESNNKKKAKGKEKATVPPRAELQLEFATARKKSNNKKKKGKEKAIVTLLESNSNEKAIVPTPRAQLESTTARNKSNNKKKEKEKGKEKAIVPLQESNSHELSLMAVEDSDFYDFDKDRTEKCFLKGQVWAIYDDDDGMPRHYGLITEVLSSKPFKVKMSWLDIQGKGDDVLMLQENTCGRFMVGRNVDIFSVNFFSHLVECERAAKEMYRIYPKKGSVWALYREEVSGEVEGRCYDIVLFLTGFNEFYGLSMAYLEKVDGFKTIFRRREIGPHAVRWLEKDDLKWISHQIPARKVLELEGVELPKDCWELDPASLPPDLLRIDWER